MKNINYYSCTQNISLERKKDGQTTVFKAEVPQKLSPEKASLVDIIIQAPSSALEDIAISYLALNQKHLAQNVIQSLLSELKAEGIIEVKNCKARLNIPYPIKHQCKSCGCSCMGQLVGPLSDKEHENILKAHKKLSKDKIFPATTNPIMKGIRPDKTVLHFLNFPQKTCLFLDENMLCTIHKNFGEAEKPAACRRFPLIGIATDAEIRIGIKPYCYSNGESLKADICDFDYIEHCQNDSELGPILDDLVENASYRPVLRDPSASAEALDQACLQEAQILAWLKSDISPEDFMRKLVSLTPPNTKEDKALSPRFYRLLAERFENLSRSLDPEVKKLGDNRHAEHCQKLIQCLKMTSKDIAATDPNGEVWAFTRLCLHQAVFLRETSRFPSLNLGVFALSLGYIAAIQKKEKAQTLLTAWFRLFAQTQAFTMLFPSPQAISTLIALL